MIQVLIESTFASWRAAARKLLNARVAPNEVLWTTDEQGGLFENFLEESQEESRAKVSAEFLRLAETAACFDDAARWSLLYRLLFRTIYENRNLLEIESDEDVRRARLMEKAVRRDEHKFHAFVRFRRVEFEGRETFVAWHEPQHFTVELASPFFVRRLGSTRFSILTPKVCAHWDLENLVYTPGVSSELAPKRDEMEDFWLTYYASIFNPHRLKIKAMKAEMPIRHWRTLPEANLIPALIRRAKEKSKF